MNDKSRKAFQVWVTSSASGIPAGTPWDSELVRSHLATWQAATAAERERCALVCRREAEIQKASAKFCGIDNLDQGDFDICEAAIRQGGDA